MNNLPIVYAGAHDKKQAVIDACFNTRRVTTDWNLWLNNPDQITTSALLEWFKLNEPLSVDEDIRGQAWVKNQLLRISLRYSKGLPLYSDYTCGVCGVRKGDPVLSENKCLYCAEQEQQASADGSRGSCGYVRPVFDPTTNAWSVMYYNSHRYDEPIMVMIAVGFRTMEEAGECLYAVTRLRRYLVLRSDGMFHSWSFARDVYSLQSIMQASLPMSPSAFRAFTEKRMGDYISDDDTTLGHQIDKALEDYARDR